MRIYAIYFSWCLMFKYIQISVILTIMPPKGKWPNFTLKIIHASQQLISFFVSVTLLFCNSITDIHLSWPQLFIGQTRIFQIFPTTQDFLTMICNMCKWKLEAFFIKYAIAIMLNYHISQTMEFFKFNSSEILNIVINFYLCQNNLPMVTQHKRVLI